MKTRLAPPNPLPRLKTVVLQVEMVVAETTDPERVRRSVFDALARVAGGYCGRFNVRLDAVDPEEVEDAACCEHCGNLFVAGDARFHEDADCVVGYGNAETDPRAKW